MTDKIIDRYRKEAECVKRCKQFDERIESVENKITESFANFSQEVKNVSKKLEENIAYNKKFQKTCEEEIEKVVKKVEKSKKEVKNLRRLNVVSIILLVALLYSLYVGF